MKKFVFFTILGIISPIICIIKSISYNQQCEIYLKQAQNATTPELALERLNLAIKYIEDKDLTHGYTSVFGKEESKNVEFWYNNIVSYRNKLKKCPENYYLLKKESLSCTTPLGISLHPHNGLWTILNIISICLVFYGGAGIFIRMDENENY